MINETVGEALILTPEINHLDTLNSNDFSNACLPMIAQSKYIVLDMSKIQFVDSSGLGAILTVVREAHTNSIGICVCAAVPSVKVLFRMVKLEKLIPIFGTREEAVAWSEGS